MASAAERLGRRPAGAAAQRPAGAAWRARQSGSVGDRPEQPGERGRAARSETGQSSRAKTGRSGLASATERLGRRPAGAAAQRPAGAAWPGSVGDRPEHRESAR
ncbi:MAG: hypothetical protein IAE85_05995 [Anaerolinea sp.]|nr:hypothetical protein [Anaerolinea sp.]